MDIMMLYQLQLQDFETAIFRITINFQTGNMVPVITCIIMLFIF
jgi:hypothetical protein